MAVITLEVASGAPLDVRRFQVREAVSVPFAITVIARTDEASLDLSAIVGYPAIFRAKTSMIGAAERRWRGICLHAAQEQAEPSGLSTYRFEIVPALWVLTMRRQHRIFQHLRATEIASALLAEWSLDRALAADEEAHPRLPYKVQYAESDYAFFCRILEQAGLTFTFPEGPAGEGVCTLSDALHAGAPRPGSIPFHDQPHDQPGEAAEQELVTEVVIGGALSAGRRVIRYRTNVLDLWAGRVFTVSGHPHPDLGDDRRLLATVLQLEGAAGEAWTARGEAVFADRPYRVPLRTPRPRARLQSATVVGPEGEAIHTDELGRVRVRFHWDRRDVPGEARTAWIRVSQTWAGAGYGMMTLPRVGQEVLVDFVDGDPENPFVTGRLYNATHPVIETLPVFQTKSIWKGDSSPDGGGFNEILFDDRKGSELVYEQAERDLRRLVKQDDTSTVGGDRLKGVSGAELETTDGDRRQITLGARLEQTDLDRTTDVHGTRRDRVNGVAAERIAGNQLTRVGGDRHVICAGARREQVELDTHLHVGRSRREAVGGTDSLTVGKRLEEQVGSYSVMADGPEGTIHLVAGSAVVIASASDATAKAGGGSFIKVDGNVTIVGPEVVINEEGGPGSLPGPGPKLPEPPRRAVIDDPHREGQDDALVIEWPEALTEHLPPDLSLHLVSGDVSLDIRWDEGEVVDQVRRFVFEGLPAGRPCTLSATARGDKLVLWEDQLVHDPARPVTFLHWVEAHLFHLSPPSVLTDLGPQNPERITPRDEEEP